MDGWPTAKLLAPTAGRPSCVLLSTGACNPVHLGHVAALHVAADRLRRAGYHPVGAFISPSHDGYVQPKAKSLGSLALSARFRLRIAEVVVEADPLVAVGSWEASQPGHWPDFPVVSNALQQWAGSEARVFYVCGTDHANKCGLWHGMGIL